MAIIEREEGLRGELEYNCSLFDATTARRILGSLEAVLDAVTKNPDCSLSRLAILPLTENDPVRIPPQPHKRTVYAVPELFEARTSRSRDLIAVASPALDLYIRRVEFESQPACAPPHQTWRQARLNRSPSSYPFDR